MKSLRVSALFFLVAFTLSLSAQTPPPYPGGVPVNRAPDFSSWKVTCQKQPAGGAPGSAPAESTPPPAAQTGNELPYASMEVIKTKDRRQVKTTDTQNGTTTRFYLGSLMALTAPGATFPRYYEGASNRDPSAYLDFSRTDFPECSWITAAMYTGVSPVNGHRCLVFVQKESSAPPASPASGGNAAPAPVPMDIAYMDADTRLPVKNQMNDLVYSYEFLTAPTSLLPVPELVQKKIDFEKARDTALSARPAHF